MFHLESNFSVGGKTGNEWRFPALVCVEAFMSYEFYKILHVFAALLLFTSLGTIAVAAGSEKPQLRRLASIAHGIALAVIFIAGFGLLARLGMFGSIPVWAWLKMGLWLILAGIVIPLRRKPELATALWLVMPFLGGMAAWLAISKPF